MMKNIKNLQSKLAESQAKLKEVTATGSAGGDMVQVTLNGEMHMVGIKIAPEVVDPSDIDMLQDLVHAAFNDAMTKVKEKIQGEMSGMMPPGFGV